MTDDNHSQLSLVLITLLKGVLYGDQHPKAWQALLELQAQVRDYISVLGLELSLDEGEGYAYLRHREQGEDEEALPRLVSRRPLSYPVSLLLVLLRGKLAEHDASSGEVRLVLSREQIVEMLRVFLPDTTNEAKLMDRVGRDINKAVDLGFLRPLRAQKDVYEVRRILISFVDAQWMSEFEQHLAEYRQHIAEPSTDES